MSNLYLSQTNLLIYLHNKNKASKECSDSVILQLLVLFAFKYDFLQLIQETKAAVRDHLADDFDTSKAMEVILQFVSTINSMMCKPVMTVSLCWFYFILL